MAFYLSLPTALSTIWPKATSCKAIAKALIANSGWRSLARVLQQFSREVFQLDEEGINEKMRRIVPGVRSSAGCFPGQARLVCLIDTTNKWSFTMALQWQDLGDGEYVAKDEAGRVLAKVVELNLDQVRRYYWYLDLPDFPEEDIEHNIFDKYELLYGIASEGCAATLEEAKVSSENAMPTPDELEQLQAEVDAAWAEKGWRDAAANN
jgi:hypothetical protein